MLAGGRGVPSMEDVDEDKQHIEMDLGLGVLEEKMDDDSSSSLSDSSSNEDEGPVEDDLPASSGTAKRMSEDKETNIMEKLVGQRQGRRKVGIEELG